MLNLPRHRNLIHFFVPPFAAFSNTLCPSTLLPALARPIDESHPAASCSPSSLLDHHRYLLSFPTVEQLALYSPLLSFIEASLSLQHTAYQLAAYFMITCSFILSDLCP